MTANDSWMFVSPSESLSLLSSHVPNEQKGEYDNLGHIFTEAAFINRRFIVFKSKGKNRERQPRPPLILATFQVTAFRADHEKGSSIWHLHSAAERCEVA